MNNNETIKINSFEIKINQINFININQIIDENEKMYISFHMKNGIILKTTCMNHKETEKWDKLTDVCSCRGYKKDFNEL